MDIKIIVEIAVIIISVIIILIVIIIATSKNKNLKIKSKIFGDISLDSTNPETSITKINENMYCISQLLIDKIVKEGISINDNTHYLHKNSLNKEMIQAERQREIITHEIMVEFKKKFKSHEGKNSYKLIKLMIDKGMSEFIKSIRGLLKENELYKYDNKEKNKDNKTEWSTYKEKTCDYIFAVVQPTITEISFVVDGITRKKFLEKCGEQIIIINRKHVNILLDDCRKISQENQNKIEENNIKQKYIKNLDKGYL